MIYITNTLRIYAEDYGDWFKLVPIVTADKSQVPHILVYFILPWKGEFKFWAPEQKEIWVWLARVVLQWWWNASDKPGEWLSRKQSAGFSPQSFSVSAFHNKKITWTVIKWFRNNSALLSHSLKHYFLFRSLPKCSCKVWRKQLINCTFIRHQLLPQRHLRECW